MFGGWQWAGDILSRIQPSLLVTLKQQVELVQAASDILRSALAKPIAPLVPRPALMLLGYVTTALYLLEHAIWSYENHLSSVELEIDVEVFARWVGESGLDAAVKDVQKAKAAGPERMRQNEMLVYHDEKKPAKL